MRDVSLAAGDIRQGRFRSPAAPEKARRQTWSAAGASVYRELTRRACLNGELVRRPTRSEFAPLSRAARRRQHYPAQAGAVSHEALVDITCREPPQDETHNREKRHWMPDQVRQ